ncbi:BREX-1 system adenine-specific DNA-methyltransferase PglX [Prosthecobacter sp. SYSU 5D2]|uniref:BREX-1 system adenine-specific DNA-methyltransferase PglX n=1 Tax=Prosthecobacter sp. SYSU 5D2 TaxID=3134134 RepID=UPI0031FF2699
MAFDQKTRNLLQRTVSACRNLLDTEFAAQRRSIFGINDDGTAAPLETLSHLSDEDMQTARLLRDRLDHLVAGLVSQGKKEAKARKEAVGRVTREQAFTVLNRLAALRMSEEREIVLECVRQGTASEGFQLFMQSAGGALGGNFESYRAYLFLLFDELAIDLGVLFSRWDPAGLLFPRQEALEAVLRELNGTGTAATREDITPEAFNAIWAEDETIGWIYQYYNDTEERALMRDPKRGGSAAPRNSRELAVRNQFFTPRYVVEFLTDNTLGRIWYEMTQGITTLIGQCRYLVRRPNEIFLQPGETAPEQPKQDNLSQEDLLRAPLFIPHRPLKDPRTILMLDPACGSMHFGLYAFDLFEVIYEEAWALEEKLGADALSRPPGMKSLHATYAGKDAFLKDVPRLIIEHNLHGIDIDPRCAQIAGLSLWLRAQRAWKDMGLAPAQRPAIKRSNIVCAEPMPGEKALLREFVEREFPAAERAVCLRLLEAIFDKMQLAGEAGSLLKIEEEIRSAIEDAREAWQNLATKPPELFTTTELNQISTAPELTGMEQAVSSLTSDSLHLTTDFWERIEERIYAALRDYAEQAENGGGFQRRLFAEDAARGFAFIDVCRKRYDVVEMNPPFGEVPINARDYIGDSYVESKSDIGMAFVNCFTARLDQHGRLGAITSRMFVANEMLETWRDAYLLGATSGLNCLLDLGYGVLDGAKVEAAAFVIDRGNTQCSQSTFVRVLDSPDKETATTELLVGGGRVRGGCIFYHQLDSFHALPGHVLAYQLPLSLARRVTGGVNLTALGGKAVVGLQPSDNFRFVRLAWEIPSEGVGRGAAWTYYAKGGEYQPYWDDIHLVVNWASNGAEIRNFVDENGKIRSRPQNLPYYFNAGVTWPERTSSDFSPRVLPEGCIFSVVGLGIFCGTANLNLAYIAGAYSRAFKLIIDAVYGSGDASSPGAMGTHYRSGVLEMLPAPLWAGADGIREHALRLVSDGLRLFESDETSRYFSCGAAAGRLIRQHVDVEIVEASARLSRMIDDHAVVDAKVLDELGFDETDRGTVNALVGPHPGSYVKTILPEDIAHVEVLWKLSESDLIRVATSKHGARRQLTMKSYAANRRYELVAHALEIDARNVAEVVAEHLFREPDMEAGVAARIVSWLVGSAFGRWDIRYATGEQAAPELPDPFAPLPVCPPGQLQNAQGLPACPEEVPAAYPVRIPWDGILVDDPNHPLDIEHRVREVIEIIWSSQEGGPTAEAIEHEACEILDVKSLRDYFRKPAGFFADHLKRYSKSRRQAPIYWPLSTASGSYTLWIYYHRLTPDTLYKCLQQFVEPKIKDVEQDIHRLRTMLSSDEGGSKEREQLKNAETLLNELKEMHVELSLWAPKWKPNLNDGVLITACPLWKLFRLPKWRKDLETCWKELEMGSYDWAHLALTIRPREVREKCKTDRSLAIAHELEELCEVKAREPKKRAAKKTAKKKSKSSEQEDLL